MPNAQVITAGFLLLHALGLNPRLHVCHYREQI